MTFRTNIINLPSGGKPQIQWPIVSIQYNVLSDNSYVSMKYLRVLCLKNSNNENVIFKKYLVGIITEIGRNFQNDINKVSHFHNRFNIFLLYSQIKHN